MVLTTRTYTTLFAATAASTTTDRAAHTTIALIRLPLSIVPQYEQRCGATGAIVPTPHKPLFRNNLWSSVEHERFLHGLEMFPNGPWKEVAKVVGTKTTRQTMTHAQKYRQKIERRLAAQPKKVATKSCRQSMSASTYVPSSHSVVGSDGSLTRVFAPWCATHQSVNEPSVASPSDAYSGVFDVSFLDHEFDALLKSLVE